MVLSSLIDGFDFMLNASSISDKKKMIEKLHIDTS